MEVEYKNSKIKKICTCASVAEKKMGVEQMIKYKIGRCHQLEGNRKSQYAVDLVHPKRLVFEKKVKKYI